MKDFQKLLEELARIEEDDTKVDTIGNKVVVTKDGNRTEFDDAETAAKMMAGMDESLNESDEDRYDVETWFKHNRQNVRLVDTTTDEDVIDLWDEDVIQAVEDGFLDPHDWKGSLLSYANHLGLLDEPVGEDVEIVEGFDSPGSVAIELKHMYDMNTNGVQEFNRDSDSFIHDVVFALYPDAMFEDEDFLKKVMIKLEELIEEDDYEEGPLDEDGAILAKPQEVMVLQSFDYLNPAHRKRLQNGTPVKLVSDICPEGSDCMGTFLMRSPSGDYGKVDRDGDVINVHLSDIVEADLMNNTIFEDVSITTTHNPETPELDTMTVTGIGSDSVEDLKQLLASMDGGEVGGVDHDKEIMPVEDVEMGNIADDDLDLNEERRMRTVKVYFDNGDHIITDVSPYASDEVIHDYYKIGKEFNVNKDDKMAKVIDVEIYGDQLPMEEFDLTIDEQEETDTHEKFMAKLDAIMTGIAGGINKPKQMFKKEYPGDNPMAIKESMFNIVQDAVQHGMNHEQVKARVQEVNPNVTDPMITRMINSVSGISESVDPLPKIGDAVLVKFRGQKIKAVVVELLDDNHFMIKSNQNLPFKKVKRNPMGGWRLEDDIEHSPVKVLGATVVESMHMIQLPDDVIEKGYRKTGPFQHEQVFYSPSLDFTGTEKEFVKAGHGYAYVQLDKHTRRKVKVDEKWDTDTKTPKSERGKYKGKTKAELKSMLAAVKKTGPHKKGSKEYEKQNELEFALRAKNNWGKVDESNLLEEHNPFVRYAFMDKGEVINNYKKVRVKEIVKLLHKAGNSMILPSIMAENLKNGKVFEFKKGRHTVVVEPIEGEEYGTISNNVYEGTLSPVQKKLANKWVNEKNANLDQIAQHFGMTAKELQLELNETVEVDELDREPEVEYSYSRGGRYNQNLGRLPINEVYQALYLLFQRNRQVPDEMVNSIKAGKDFDVTTGNIHVVVNTIPGENYQEYVQESLFDSTFPVLMSVFKNGKEIKKNQFDIKSVLNSLDKYNVNKSEFLDAMDNGVDFEFNLASNVMVHISPMVVENLTESENEELEDAVQSYIETALWSSPNQNADEEYLENYEVSDEFVNKARADCNAFYQQAKHLLDGDLNQVMHDFWLTRNGHGAGFWDGDYPEHGDELTKIAHSFGEVTLYLGDDGLVYQS